MTDLDNTEILTADESLTENSTTINDSKASLTIVSGTDPDTFQIDKETIIGRSSPADIIIPAPSLSKQHAKITINNGQFFITDLGSSNKTFHNKVQLQPNVCYALHNGDEIKFGDIICSFNEQKQTDAKTESPKQNGVYKSPNPVSSTVNDENNQVTVPPVVVEPKQLNNNDQLEIVSSPKTNENITENTKNEEQAIKETISEEQMDTESPHLVIDEKQSENVNPTEEESVPPTKMEQEPSTTDDTQEEEPSSNADVEQAEESSAVSGRGVPRKNARRARGRRGAATRPHIVSTRIVGGRRQPIVPSTNTNEENNTTLEETITTETEDSPKKSTSTAEIKEEKSNSTTPSQTNTNSNVRTSARIKDRASSGRTRQFPYTDDYVDLDNLEKQSKTKSTTPTTTRQSNRGRSSTSPQKRLSLRQQPIDASNKSDTKDDTNVYEQIDNVVENKELTPKSSAGRKRKSATPAATETSKRSRLPTPQTVPTVNTRRKQTSTTEESPTVSKSNRRTTTGQEPVTTTTPKRGRKSTKSTLSTEPSSENQVSTTDRPVRIALSSHLNFEQNQIDILRKIGFEIMDESCQVDALVVDRIRRTKKFFMCLARGAHILSPTWVDTMIKENRYIPYDKYYLDDKNAETRYGFQLRESVRLAKQGPIFQNKKFYCTQDTAPPYDDLKDIIEAGGGKLIEKMNMSKPGKDIICVVAQTHKNEYEDLYRKGLPVVSEEFILSGISKQKLDFDAFSLFQTSTTVKSNIGK